MQLRNYPKQPDIHQLWYHSSQNSFITLKRINDINQAVFSENLCISTKDLSTSLQCNNGICYLGLKNYTIFTGLYVEYKGPFSIQFLTDNQGINLQHQNIVFSDSNRNLYIAYAYLKDIKLLRLRRCNNNGELVDVHINNFPHARGFHYIGHLIIPPYDVCDNVFARDYTRDPSAEIGSNNEELLNVEQYKQWFPDMLSSGGLRHSLEPFTSGSLFLAKNNYCNNNGQIEANKFYLLCEFSTKPIYHLLEVSGSGHPFLKTAITIPNNIFPELLERNLLYMGFRVRNSTLDLDKLKEKNTYMVFVDEHYKLQVVTYDQDKKAIITTPLRCRKDYTKHISAWRHSYKETWLYLGIINSPLYEPHIDPFVQQISNHSTNNIVKKEETDMTRQGSLGFHPKEKVTSLEFNEASQEMIALRAAELAKLLGYKEKVDGNNVFFFQPNKLNGIIKITPEELKALFTKEIVENSNALVFEFALDNDYIKSSTSTYLTDK